MFKQAATLTALAVGVMAKHSTEPRWMLLELSCRQSSAAHTLTCMMHVWVEANPTGQEDNRMMLYHMLSFQFLVHEITPIPSRS